MNMNSEYSLYSCGGCGFFIGIVVFFGIWVVSYFNTMNFISDNPVEIVCPQFEAYSNKDLPAKCIKYFSESEDK